MTPMTWAARLADSRSESEVVEVCREFLALWTPPEIAQLPEQCRPRKIADASNITAYAFVLMRQHCEERDGKAPIHKMAAFFSRASTRLSEILAAEREPPERDARPRTLTKL